MIATERSQTRLLYLILLSFRQTITWRNVLRERALCDGLDSVMCPLRRQILVYYECGDLLIATGRQPVIAVLRAMYRDASSHDALVNRTKILY